MGETHREVRGEPRDASGRVRRRRQGRVQSYSLQCKPRSAKRLPLKTTHGKCDGLPRRRKSGIVVQLDKVYDGLPAHTVSTISFRQRKAGVRKPSQSALCVVDYGPRTPLRKGTAQSDRTPARRRVDHCSALTTDEREELARACTDSFRLLVDTRARGKAIYLDANDFNNILGAGRHNQLDDFHVNAYCELVNARNRSYFASGCDERWRLRKACVADDALALLQGGRQRTFIFSSFLHTRLAAEKYEFEHVKRWTTRAGLRVLDYGKLFFPVNIDNAHWVVVGVDMPYQRLVYLDSMGGRDSGGVLERVRNWLIEEVRDKYGENVVTTLGIGEWKTVVNPQYIPRQRDSSSCGVFVVMLANLLELGQTPAFTQADIPVMRERTALAILRGALPDSS